MLVHKHEIFPIEVMQFKVQDITTEDADAAISDIEYLIKEGKYIWEKEGGLSPKVQSNSILFREQLHWWEPDRDIHPVWQKIKDSFKQAATYYMENSDMFKVEPNEYYIGACRAWFYRADRETLLESTPPVHNHYPAHVSGVLYLKNPGNVEKNGTVLISPNEDLVNHRPVLLRGEELTWLLFPGWLSHQASNDINNDEKRYVVAADAFIGNW